MRRCRRVELLGAGRERAGEAAHLFERVVGQHGTVPTVAELGQGVVDMRESRAARKETPAWKELISWIDSQQKPSARTVQDLRLKPKAAARRAPESESGASISA